LARLAANSHIWIKKIWAYPLVKIVFKRNLQNFLNNDLNIAIETLKKGVISSNEAVKKSQNKRLEEINWRKEAFKWRKTE